jgi:hypothetical protein
MPKRIPVLMAALVAGLITCAGCTPGDQSSGTSGGSPTVVTQQEVRSEARALFDEGDTENEILDTLEDYFPDLSDFIEDVLLALFG